MSDSDPTKPRLIIADDDPVVRSMLSMALEGAFDVIGVAEDADSAVRMAGERAPDAALVDVEMPGGGGRRAVSGIARVSPRTAIVVLSGDESDVEVRNLIAAGATAYRRKGEDVRALAECLTASIQTRAGERFSAP